MPGHSWTAMLTDVSATVVLPLPVLLLLQQPVEHPLSKPKLPTLHPVQLTCTAPHAMLTAHPSTRGLLQQLASLELGTTSTHAHVRKYA
jgi:hypothetical protein